MNNISQQLETNTNEITKFRTHANEGNSISLINEIYFDKCFPQVNLENNVKTTTTKDKGTLDQNQMREVHYQEIKSYRRRFIFYSS